MRHPFPHCFLVTVTLSEGQGQLWGAVETFEKICVVQESKLGWGRGLSSVLQYG